MATSTLFTGNATSVRGYNSSDEERIEILNRLTFLGGISIGSRALDVPRSNSDWDIVIQRSLVEQGLLDGSFGKYKTMATDLSKYFTVSPQTGNNALVKLQGTRIDLILYEHQSDVAIVKQAMEELKTHPKLDLNSKPYRVKAYQNILVSLGFKRKFVSLWSRLKQCYTLLKGAPSETHNSVPF